jgi:acyl-CoA reductase-like NAD-dependent aldehyde dehydrogenase
VKERIARARRAQEALGADELRRRAARCCATILDHLLAHADELVEIICKDSGKTRENAMLGEIWTVSEKLRHNPRARRAAPAAGAGPVGGLPPQTRGRSTTSRSA